MPSLRKDNSWMRLLGKLRTLVSYTLLAIAAYYFCVYFNIENVSQGRMPFKYEDMKAFINSKHVVVTIAIVGINIVILSQVSEIVRYLAKNDSICGSLYTAISYTMMIIICYGIAIAQAYAFLQGIEVDPKGLPFF